MTVQLGDDAHYVDTTARLFGWAVDRPWAGRLLLRRGEWAVAVDFSACGGFLRGALHRPVRSAGELRLPEVIDLLERGGAALRPAAS